MSPFEQLDERFKPLHKPTARLDHLYDGCRWAEGPAYFPAHRALVWSDIPNNRILRYDEATGDVGVFRHPSNYSNGHTVDPQGRLVSAQHGDRRVSRLGRDGKSFETLADKYMGKRLNSPNDLVFAKNGDLYFTDPPYGIDASGREGHPGEQEYDGCYVFRFEPATGVVFLADRRPMEATRLEGFVPWIERFLDDAGLGVLYQI